MNTATHDSEIAAKSDTSAFVDHLRLVHLTLCVFCLIATIAVSSKESSSAQRAYQQVGTLLRIQSLWRDGQWLQEFVSSKQSTLGNIQFETGQPANVYILRPGPTGDLAPLYNWLALASDSERSETALKDKLGSLKSLADTERVWDALYLYRNAVELSGVVSGWSITSDGTTSVINPLQGEATRIQEADRKGARVLRAAMLLRADLLAYFQNIPAAQQVTDLIKSDNSRCFLLAWQSAFDLLLFRAECAGSRFDLQGSLTKGIELAPSQGLFSTSFPDVAELAKNLKTLPLPELQIYFRSEVDRTGDKIEFAPVKLPVQSIAYWGTAIIVALTAYWLSVFRDFAGRITSQDKGWGTPWIGISREPASRALFLCTIAAPALTVPFLLFWGLDSAVPIVFRACITIAGLGLTTMLVLGVFRCWQAIQRIPKPPVDSPAR